MIKLQLPVWTLVLAFGTAVAAETDGEQSSAAEERDMTMDQVLEDDSSWTWFGMGYESRHKRYFGNQGGSGAERRPTGGFSSREREGGSDTIRGGSNRRTQGLGGTGRDSQQGRGGSISRGRPGNGSAAGRGR